MAIQSSRFFIWPIPSICISLGSSLSAFLARKPVFARILRKLPPSAQLQLFSRPQYAGKTPARPSGHGLPPSRIINLDDS